LWLILQSAFAAAENATMTVPDVADCPWCERNDALKFVGDGLGNVAVHCAGCGSRGPSIAMRGDFEEADREAAQRWSAWKAGAAMPAETVVALRRWVEFENLTGGRLDDGSFVSVPYGTLRGLIEAR
jgi:hypothetical protein